MESEVADSDDYSSKSDYVRQLIDRHDELQDTVAELKTENDRLHRERRQLLERREEHTELVEYVENELSVAERQRMYEQAPVQTRIKWWFTGRP